jgi:hypothetical protein
MVPGMSFHVFAAYGDPHFLTWEGTRFDFHGQGDYYLVRARRQARPRVWFSFSFFLFIFPGWIAVLYPSPQNGVYQIIYSI